ncbi:MAG: hypothetical protein BGO55_00500 [Sphingobacteriales bacterium 50-39]|nr:hypothetical protein [Sphingobacteriales bacterium]OJW53594.1 MAG: hypothetical protein BGO55_00500 [Sphingobacteriales bacterium 50-39]
MERQPKVGEPVLYYPAKPTPSTPDPANPFAKKVESPDADVTTNDNAEGPIAAVITRQWGGSDRRVIPMVNLTVFPDGAAPVCKSSVPHESNKSDGQAHWKYPEE